MRWLIYLSIFQLIHFSYVLGAQFCTEGFMDYNYLVTKASQIDENLSTTAQFNSTNARWIFPGLQFNCTAKLIGITLAVLVKTTGNVFPRLELWEQQRTNPSNYSFISSTLITLLPNNFSTDGVFYYEFSEPMFVQSGYVLGISQPNSPNNSVVMYYDNKPAAYTAYRLINLNNHYIQLEEEYVTEHKNINPLIYPNTNPAGCHTGFLSYNTVAEKAQEIANVDLKYRELHAFPSIRFTCDTNITKWFVAVKTTVNGHLHPIIKLLHQSSLIDVLEVNRLKGTQVAHRVYEFIMNPPMPVQYGDVLVVRLFKKGNTKSALYFQEYNGPENFVIEGTELVKSDFNDYPLISVVVEPTKTIQTSSTHQVAVISSVVSSETNTHLTHQTTPVPSEQPTILPSTSSLVSSTSYMISHDISLIKESKTLIVSTTSISNSSPSISLFESSMIIPSFILSETLISSSTSLLVLSTPSSLSKSSIITPSPVVSMTLIKSLTSSLITSLESQSSITSFISTTPLSVSSFSQLETSIITPTSLISLIKESQPLVIPSTPLSVITSSSSPSIIFKSSANISNFTHTFNIMVTTLVKNTKPSLSSTSTISTVSSSSLSFIPLPTSSNIINNSKLSSTVIPSHSPSFIITNLSKSKITFPYTISSSLFMLSPLPSLHTKPVDNNLSKIANVSLQTTIGASVGSVLFIILCITIIVITLVINLRKRRTVVTTGRSYSVETILESSAVNPVYGARSDNTNTNEEITFDDSDKMETIIERDPVNLNQNEAYQNQFFSEKYYYMMGGVLLPSIDNSIYWEPEVNAINICKQFVEKNYCEIDQHSIIINGHLGSGQFGTVAKGVWNCPYGGSFTVAVKTLKDNASEEEKVKFLQEAAIMGQFHHPNIVKLYGVVTVAEPVMIVLEIISNGDLGNYLNMLHPIPGELVPSTLPTLLLSFCRQIALGMEYLSKKCFVHRDLAARNILVTEQGICKIADFGMSRDLQDENYYISHAKTIPIKWTAPEALVFRRYSTASDVWSFGVVLYEIWSLGHKPFEEHTNKESLQLVNSGYRLPPPPGCPRPIYKMMIQCWHPETSSRPTFVKLVSDLSQADVELLSSQLSNEDDTCSSESPVMGGPLNTGHNLYIDLQRLYM